MARDYPFQKRQEPRPKIRRLRSPPEKPGRKRRGPSLAAAGLPRKQSLMCLLSTRSGLGAEESVLLVPNGPTLAPGHLTAVIVDKIKHIYFLIFKKRANILVLPGAQGQICQEHTVTQPTSIVPGHSYQLSADESNCLSRASHDDSAPHGLLSEKGPAVCLKLSRKCWALWQQLHQYFSWVCFGCDPSSYG